MFRLTWGTFSGSSVRAILQKLAQPDFSANDEIINYYALKYQKQFELWICKPSDIIQLDEIRRRVLVVILGDSVDSSIIEFNVRTGGVVHYNYLESADSFRFRHENDRCSDCNHTTVAINQWVRSNENVPTWEFRAQTINGVPERDGLSLIWAITCLAEQTKPRPMPPNYHLKLRDELLSDIQAACASARCEEGISENLIDMAADREGKKSANPEEFWVNLGQRHGFGRRLWDKLQELSAKPDPNTFKSMGHEKASKLLHMALDIASPTVFISSRVSAM